MTTLYYWITAIPPELPNKGNFMAKTEKVEKMNSNFKFKSVKKVTGIPFHKIEIGKPSFLRFTSPITLGVMKKKPAEFANVDNLESGEVMKLLLGKVLSRQLLEAYPEDGFIGKCFRIEKGEAVEGNENKYYPYEIEEIEVA